MARGRCGSSAAHGGGRFSPFGGTEDATGRLWVGCGATLTDKMTEKNVEKNDEMSGIVLVLNGAV